MRYVSLFAGIGGFDLALERLGHECVYANDFDKYCKQTYDKHFKTKLDTRSIVQIAGEEIPDHELLVGGFPCQSFSIAGQRRGFADTRGTLFYDICRILTAKRPPYLLLENVKGLLSHDNGRTFETILRTLDELGYDIQWQVLNSKNFGVPQNRERVFIVGHLRGESRPKVFPIRTNDKTSSHKEGSLTANTLTASYAKGPAASRPLIYVGGVLSEKQRMWLDDGKLLSRNFPQGQRVYSSEGISATLASQAGGLGAKTGLYMLTEKRTEEAKALRREAMQQGKDWSPRRGKELVPRTDNQANTLTASQSKEHLLTDGIKIRRLTPLECERLQGFPDGWTQGVSDTQRYKQLGNAVTVNVVQYIASYFPH